MAVSSPTNPYESPREATSNFKDSDAPQIADLQRRIAELERRLGKNWLVSSNHLLRILGIWGYLILGYMVVITIFFAIMSVVWFAGFR